MGSSKWLDPTTEGDENNNMETSTRAGGRSFVTIVAQSKQY